MNMWERRYLLHELGHGWNGSMTLPRELSIKNGRLIQKPYHKIETYQKNGVELNDLSVSGIYENTSLYGSSQRLDLQFEMKESNQFTIEFFRDTNEKLSLIFDKSKNEMVLDRCESEYAIVNTGDKNDFTRSQLIDLTNPVQLTIFLDVSSIEIFVNDGEHVFTSLYFSKELSERILFQSQGVTHVNKLLKWDLV
jgi:beta-fructofuranosidase